MSNKRVIYKYEFEGHRPEVYFPSGSKLLDVEFQGSKLCVWALVDPDVEISNKGIADVMIAGTGWEFEVDFISWYNHYKTFHIDGYVWHVFTKKEVIK